MLCIEGLEGVVVDEDAHVGEAGDAAADDMATTVGSKKRTQLGLYSSMQWHAHP